jgi:pilus assembly protein CpaC
MEATDKKMTGKHFRISRRAGLAIATALSLSMLGIPATGWSDDVVPTQPTQPTMVSTDNAEANATSTITVEPGKAKKWSLDRKIKKANILAPEVADVWALTPNALLITGKKPGTTQVIVTDDADQVQILNVEVTSNIETLRKNLKSLFPDSNIQVEEDNGSLTLHGQVRTLQIARQAEEISVPYASGGKVSNLLEIGGGQQVMLQVRFAEVSKSAEQQLGFNFGGTDGVSVYGSNVGPNPLGVTPGATAGAANMLLIPATALSTASMFGVGAFGSTAFAYFINALESNSLLRMLAEPDLVTTSGQQASFLAGGSIPYPVPQTGTGGGSTITIAWQDYGVNLKFTPIVLGDGRIRLNVAPEVSELDYAHALTLSGTSVPALTKRTVNTTVELGEGQTFALAGLLQDNITASNQQFPILGDLPVLGALFRSVSYQRQETELVVMVTPVLVHGMDPADVTEIPGGKWRDPKPLNLYLLKDLGGEVVNAPQAPPANGPIPRFHGEVGFEPPAGPK